MPTFIYKIFSFLFKKNGMYFLKDNYVGWFKNGQLHKEDGPALVSYYGEEVFWYQNGVLHRENGAAIERDDGDNEWWINGVRISEEEFNSLNIKNNLNNNLKHNNKNKNIKI